MIQCPRFLRFHRAEKWNPTDLNETSWSSANQRVGRRWRTAGRCRWNRHTPTATTQIKGSPDRTSRTSNILESHQKPETKDVNSDWVMLCKGAESRRLWPCWRQWPYYIGRCSLAPPLNPQTHHGLETGSSSPERYTPGQTSNYERPSRTGTSWRQIQHTRFYLIQERARKEAGGTAARIYSIQTGHANLKWTGRPTWRVEEEVLVWTRSSVGAPWLQNR